MKHIGQALRWLAPWAYIGLLLTTLCIPIAYEQRGYWAIGGEWAFAVFVPLLAGCFKLAGRQNAKRPTE
jgi:hypothetical protein